jgi:cysteine-rich repeat protein
VRCQTAVCGDGYTNFSHGEYCDSPTDGPDCNRSGAPDSERCKQPICGDGYVNSTTGEQCDPGPFAVDPGCDALCHVKPGYTCSPGLPCNPICGDGVVVPGEMCDDNHNGSACGLCNSLCNAVTKTETRATGSITAVGANACNAAGTGVGTYHCYTNGDNFTISDGVHPSVTFEFYTGTPVTTGRVSIDAKNAPNDAVGIAAKIAVAINSVGPALAVTAMGSGATVSLTNDNPSAVGNVAITTSVNPRLTNGQFTVVGMSGGLGYDCPTGVGCGTSKDCQSGVCMANQCQAPTCSDSAHNGNETDLNCGGGTCPPCVDGAICIGNSDCQSGVCGASGTCAPPTCSDGVQNGTETGVDCDGVSGGITCPVC